MDIAVVSQAYYNAYPGSSMSCSQRVRCPFCGKKDMNINLTHNSFKCWHASCSLNEGGSGMDLLCVMEHGRKYRELSEVEQREMRCLADRLQGIDSETHIRRTLPAPKAKHSPNTIARDSQLHRVYSALLRALSLSKEHKAELMERGLSEEHIQRNRYRTLPDSVDDLVQRMRIDESLLEHVPGFYMKNGDWAIRRIPGMLIPVRNWKGQITGICIHDRARDAKYMSLSSRDLPHGTGQRSRVHIPLASSKLVTRHPFVDNRRIIVTEGVLKADVANALANNQYPIVGVQGVDNMAEMPNIIKELGCQQLFEALDQDKALNPGVYRGVKRLQKIADNAGVPCSSLYWDPDEALRLSKELYTLLGEKEKADIKKMAAELKPQQDGIWQLLREIAQKSAPDAIKKTKWTGQTKGIDDAMLNGAEFVWI